MRLIAPFGFYGAGNIGDEATLHGFARLVRSRPPSPSVWVGSCDPRHDARVEPAFRYYPAGRKSLRRRWATAVAEAVVFPGGTPIMDGLGSWPLDEVVPIVAEARQAGRAVAFVGVGTETLDRPESRARFRDHLAPHVRHWSVRSRHDADRLASWGVTAERVTVAADMAWLIEPVSAELGRTILEALDVDPDASLIGINVNNEAIMRQREPELFESLAAFADGLVEDRGATVVFFCSEIRTGPEYDQAAAGHVMAAMRHANRARMVPNRYWSPRELMSILACCRLVVSTRYHVCLFAALQQVPFVALQRSDKVRDLCADLQWHAGLPLGHIRPPALRDLLEGIEHDRARMVDVLNRGAQDRAQQSWKNQTALDALIGASSSRA